MDKVDEMEAGRELDALVAERVMGLRLTPYKRPLSEGPAGWKDAEGTLKYSPVELPRYSTDIKAAWDVAEKMKGVSVAKRADGKWTCWHWDRVHHTGAGETAPLAICRAALSCVAYLAELATLEAASASTTPVERSETQK